MKNYYNKRLGALLISIFALATIIPSVAQTSNVLSRSVVVKDVREDKDSKSLPKDYTTINYQGRQYYQSKGRYYIEIEDGYRLVSPPTGLKIDNLPKGYTSITSPNHKYYCCRGVVYIGLASGEYETSLPEIGLTLPELPEAGVREVLIDGKLHYESEGLVYKEFADGEQYVVICTLKSLDS